MQQGMNEYISNPEDDPVTGARAIFICRAAKSGAETVGLFCAAVPLETIQNMIGYIQLGKTGRGWIIAHDGSVIAHRNKNFIKQNISSIFAVDPKAVSSLSSAMALGRMGNAFVKGSGNKSEFIACTPISGTSWTFALSVAGDDLRSSAEDTSASITEIISNIDSMGNRITNQAAGVEETAGGQQKDREHPR